MARTPGVIELLRHFCRGVPQKVVRQDGPTTRTYPDPILKYLAGKNRFYPEDIRTDGVAPLPAGDRKP